MKPVGLLDENYLSQPYLHFYKYLVNVRPIGQTLLDHGLNNIYLFLTFHHENLVVTTWCSWWKWRILELSPFWLTLLFGWHYFLVDITIWLTLHFCWHYILFQVVPVRAIFTTNTTWWRRDSRGEKREQADVVQSMI